MKSILIILLACFGLATVAYAQSPQPGQKKQYIYVLKLAPRLLDAANWTDADNAAVQEHFARLQKMTEEGTVILAGRTTTEDPFGIVIFEAGSDEEAQRISEEDPAVQKGVMTVEVFPYEVALMRTAAPQQ